MTRLKTLLAAAFALLLLWIPQALAEQAEEITRLCTYNQLKGEHCHLTDNSYATALQIPLDHSRRLLTVTAPEGKTIGGVQIRWDETPLALTFEAQDESGEWQVVAQSTDAFYCTWVELPGVTAFRCYPTDQPRAKMSISEMTVLTPGEVPDTIQQWEEPGDKVDLMLLSGHPDDEVLWFGGLIAYYSDQGKRVLVICSSQNRNLRRLELLDCLWVMGCRVHPVFANYFDFYTNDMQKVLHSWRQSKVLERYTGYIRRYRPDVLVLQDVNGEYGHGIHRTVSWAGRETSVLAADPEQYPDQVAQYGTWQVKKVYIHLYGDDPTVMDWSVPLESLGGISAQDAARAGFAMHVSQQNRGYAVLDGGQYDNTLFGLYSSTVGEDVAKNDLFEHIDAEASADAATATDLAEEKAE